VSVKDYLLIGGALLAGWLLFTRPMTPEEARRSALYRLVKEAICLAALAAMIWFMWWISFGQCLFACSYLGFV
jgi:hypothetical protein